MTAPPEDRSIGELIGEVTSDLSRLFRQEVDLAKAELKQEAGKASKAGALFVVAGTAGLLVTVMLSFALVYALSEVIPPGWAALIVAVIWAVIGYASFSAARQRWTAVDPVPRQTVETLKEDAQWLRNPTR